MILFPDAYIRTGHSNLNNVSLHHTTHLICWFYDVPIPHLITRPLVRTQNSDVHINLFTKATSVQKHGGLLINLNDVFTYDIRTLYEYSDTWGVYLLTFQDLVSIDLLLSAIYRPPHDDNNNNENISKFIAEFSPIIDILQRENKSAAIVGDFDINLLQINNPRKIQRILRYDAYK